MDIEIFCGRPRGGVANMLKFDMVVSSFEHNDCDTLGKDMNPHIPLTMG